MMKKIDLHIHSNFSDDGEFSPEDIIDMANEQGMNWISITDHNSIKANKIAMEYCKDKDIKFLSGIEIDCQYKGINLHLLGYGFNFEDERFDQLEKNIITQEKEASLQRIKNIKSILELNLDENEIFRKAIGGIITGELIAEVLLNDEKNSKAEVLLPYRVGGTRGDMPFVNFYWDYFSQGKPAYAHVEFISLIEAINLIKENNGKAILAHPGNNLRGKFEIIDELIEVGIDGIEVFSSYHSDDDIKFFYKKAINNNLLITCGTDFHGKNKPNIKIGNFKNIIDSNIILKESNGRDYE